jgi:HSP20 family protein
MLLTKYTPETSLASWLDTFMEEPWYRSSAAFTPDLDIEEREKDYLVRIDVPGMEKKDLDISVEDGILTISGERKSEAAHREEKRYYYFERSVGKFTRSLRLPRGAETGALEANLKNGVLEVTVPKPVAAASHKVEVK